MENLGVGLFGVGLLLAFLFFDVPVGFGLGFIGVIGYGIVTTPNAAVSVLGILPFSNLGIYAFMTVPLFIIMGTFLEHADIGDDVFGAAKLWLGGLRGGFVIATLAASAAFSAASGSSMANSAVFSRVAIPQMVKYGVDKKLAAGAVAAGGTVDDPS